MSSFVLIHINVLTHSLCRHIFSIISDCMSHELNQYQAEEINKAHNTVGLSLVMLEPPTQ